MKSPLHILHLEDDPGDAALIEASLEAGGIACAVRCVHTRGDFVEVLQRGGIDLILTDYALPGFDGLSALQIVRDQHPDLPVILVSGRLGEEQAIDSLLSGATDYVLKDRLARLAPAVRRAMQEVAERAERRRLEAQFIESQKRDVLGQLAGGIAHDFNNIVSVIMGYSDMMMSDLQPGDSLHEQAGEIYRASERAAALTRQLLVFSRKQILQQQVLDLDDVVNKTAGMLRQLISEDIELSIRTGQQAGRVMADPGYIGQILMNLTVNARDAMPTGGKLSIRTFNLTCEPLSHPHVTPGEYVMLTVSDTGTGMTEEVKPHLFEAFFTTKPEEKGTGLGLSTCLTIVNQSAGFMDFDTELGKGTTFRVFLPRVDGPLKAADLNSPVEVLPRGTETLLLVEDEDSVRDLACAVLGTLGYTVLVAHNGRDGLRVASQHQGASIDLVITDVIMPQMGGRVMAETLTASYPELEVLFISGYADDKISKHGGLEPGVAFLPKPYSPACLSRKVRELLDRVAVPRAGLGKPTAQNVALGSGLLDYVIS